MIKSVVNQYNWSPLIMGDFFIDRIDHLGLEYWYEEVKHITKELTPKK